MLFLKNGCPPPAHWADSLRPDGPADVFTLCLSEAGTLCLRGGRNAYTDTGQKQEDGASTWWVVA